MICCHSHRLARIHIKCYGSISVEAFTQPAHKLLFRLIQPIVVLWHHQDVVDAPALPLDGIRRGRLQTTWREAVWSSQGFVDSL